MKFTVIMPAILLSFIITAAINSKAPSLPPDVAAEWKLLNRTMDYNLDVKPILSDKCVACHGPDKAKQKAGLRLDAPVSALGPLPESPGKVAIQPKQIWKSELVYRIISRDPEYAMPTPGSHLTLTAKEKAILIKWIEQGAIYQPHWAFVPPVSRAIPVASDIQSTQHPIDQFIRARLAEVKLQPSKEADKALLLRRLSLDITGLPPSDKELNSFMSDTNPIAYEEVVDRLLASPHYGERMAADWLDLARFADTYGYSVDRYRDMSPYRDWVIGAFNKNMPYDRFIHEQLAGDLMPNPTRDMRIATAFNRIHQQNMEGGIVEEEFQTEYVLDRTNTFGQAFLAMSVGCARCHDHKYDPISQKNYYELSGFFNKTLEAGQISWNNDMPTPTLLLPDGAQQKVMDSLKAFIQKTEATLGHHIDAAKMHTQSWLNQGGHNLLLTEALPQTGLMGFYRLNDHLGNEQDTSMKGIMKHDAGETGDLPVFASARNGKVLSMNGDVYLDVKNVGVFSAAMPFTIGMWINIPKTLNDGVIFHKSDGERLYNFKGFNLSLKKGKFEITMAHAAPSNAIIKTALAEAPKNQWIHVALRYDGSGMATGFELFQDGKSVSMETIIDKLYKDILFYRKEEPALQIGGWWRGQGFTGGQVDDIVVYNRQLTSFEMGILAGKHSWQSAWSSTPKDPNSPLFEPLRDYFAHVIDSTVQLDLAHLQKERQKYYDYVKDIRQVMVMEDNALHKTTHILNRGQYDLKGPEVQPGTPEAILSFSKKYPRNRLGLAQWLTDAKNPLTARVAVNRLWQQFFGTGLVKTSEDFGNQGELPSHPALLDWLALRFMESGWDIKKMIRLIVTSSTYKQDSYASAPLREMDPENRLLARGPSARLTAEMIRDNVLTASGLLNRKMGGESVKPYQPAGLWEINSMSYRADSTDAMYRRSVYVVVKRSVPFPTLGSFDASERSSCISRRQQTNTPLQALVTLNDPAFVESAKALGASVCKEKDVSAMITRMYTRLTARKPTEKELELLKSLHQQEWNRFHTSPEKMKGWINAGIATIGEWDKSLVAANAVVASVIMNSDATLTKR